MEVSEVISLHVAIPVLCVLVFIFFVFAFGFTTPVQPPSFNFHEEQILKKNKKSKEKKLLQSNGFIGGDDKPVSKTSSKSTNTLNNRIKQSSDVKVSNKLPYEPLGAAPAIDDEQQNAGEWTTFMSKKEKKLRSKKEEDESDREKETSANTTENKTASPSGKQKTKKIKKLTMAEEYVRAANEGTERQIISKDDLDHQKDEENANSPADLQVSEPASKSTDFHIPSRILDPVYTPTPKLFEIEFDIQTVEKKSLLDPAAIQQRLNKSPKKKKKDKKEKVNTEPISNDESKASQSVPQVASPLIIPQQQSVKIPDSTTSSLTVTPQSTVSSDGETTIENPKLKKRKPRREN